MSDFNYKNPYLRNEFIKGKVMRGINKLDLK